MEEILNILDKEKGNVSTSENRADAWYGGKGSRRQD